MEFCQFFIYTNNTISFTFTTLFFKLTIRTIFTLIQFLCSSELISSYRSAVKITEFFSVRTFRISVFIYVKINRSVWIFSVFFISIIPQKRLQAYLFRLLAVVLFVGCFFTAPSNLYDLSKSIIFYNILLFFTEMGHIYLQRREKVKNLC